MKLRRDVRPDGKFCGGRDSGPPAEPGARTSTSSLAGPQLLPSKSVLFLVGGCVCRASATCRPGDLSQPSPDSPMEASPLLFLLESDVFQLQWTRDEADLAAFFHQTADPPVIVELLQMLSGGHGVNMDKNPSASSASNSGITITEI